MAVEPSHPDSITAPRVPRSDLIERTDDRFKLHKDIYSDPDIFEWEMEELFEKNWVFLAHENRVEQPNDYLTLKVGRQPVILSRDDRGELHCFYNRCRHRGTMVCRSDQGNTARFRCMYHAWTYSSRGDLVTVPDREGYPEDMDMDELGLVEVPRLKNFHGLVFVSLNEDVVPFDEYLGQAKPYLEQFFAGRNLTMSPAQTFTYDGNWKLQMENGIDGYHPPFVHPTSNVAGNTKDTSSGYEFDPEDLNKAVSFRGGHGGVIMNIPRSNDSGPRYRAMKRWGFGTPENLELEDSALFVHMSLFPNLSLIGSWVAIRRPQPISVDETEVTYYFYHPDDADPELVEQIQIERDEFFGGGAGSGSPDDIVAMHNVQKGCQAEGLNGSEVAYNDLSKGLHREVPKQPDGLPPYRRAGHLTDDAHFRGMYSWWYERWIETHQT